MLYLKPSEILYSQESIRNIFAGSHIHSGKPIGETLDELADGHTTVEEISVISVKEINGMWTTADNRRLWVFKNFELLGGCTCIPVIQTNRIDPRKLNSPYGGKRIRVKGDPGSKWYNKLITDPAQYQNCLRGSIVDPYNIASSASKIDVCDRNKPNQYQTVNNEECINTGYDIDTNHAFSLQTKPVFGYHEQSGFKRTASNTVHTLYERSTSTFYTPQIGRQRSSSPVTNENETLQATLLDQTFKTLTLNSTASNLHPTNISNDTNLRKYARQAADCMPYAMQANSDRPAYSNENSPVTNIKIDPTFSLNTRAQCEERTQDADLHISSIKDGSTFPGARPGIFEGGAHKAVTKLKSASRQSYTHLINVKQIKSNPESPSLIMLEPSKIRYTKDAIECPLLDARWPTVKRRLVDLLETENYKPLEVYMAYNMYWVKEENDVLWALKDHPDAIKFKRKLKVLVIQDNDAFLDFMRKQKPWLQISDILQLGQNIELIK